MKVFTLKTLVFFYMRSVTTLLHSKNISRTGCRVFIRDLTCT